MKSRKRHFIQLAHPIFGTSLLRVRGRPRRRQLLAHLLSRGCWLRHQWRLSNRHSTQPPIRHPQCLFPPAHRHHSPQERRPSPQRPYLRPPYPAGHTLHHCVQALGPRGSQPHLATLRHVFPHSEAQAEALPRRSRRPQSPLRLPSRIQVRVCLGLLRRPRRRWRLCPRLRSLRARGWQICWRDAGRRRFIFPPPAHRSLPLYRDKLLAQPALLQILPAGARRSRAAARRSPRLLKRPLRHKPPPHRTLCLDRGVLTRNRSFSGFKKVGSFDLSRVPCCIGSRARICQRALNHGCAGALCLGA